MAYFGMVPFSHNEFHEGQAGDCTSYPMCPSGSDGEIHLGFDRIVDEVSNEFFFYGSSHSHHHEEMYFPSDVFGLNVPDQQFCGQPLLAYGELCPGNPDSHWQQGTMSPTIGFRSSLLSDYRDFSLTDPYSYSQEREMYRGNTITPVTNVFDSSVERGNRNQSFQLGFDNVDSQCPIFLDNYPFGQEARGGSGNREACLTDASGRCEIGLTWPSRSGRDREATGRSIQLVEANQGSNENTVDFCNAVEKIRNVYPAFDMKTNTGKIWSVATRFPDHILGELKFRISIWTDCSPYPLLLTQHAGCITRNLIVEILHCTNQYSIPEECLLNVCGSDEFLQNNHTLGSHESLRKATTCIQLRLHSTSTLKQSLARTHEDDQRQFSVNQLLQHTCAWRLTRQNLVSVLMKYRDQVEYLLQNEHKVDTVIEVAKAICSVLCFVETRDITDAVKKLHAVPLEKAQNSLQNVETPDKALIEAAVTDLSMAISRLIHVYSCSFDADFQLASIPKSFSCADISLDSQLSFTVYAAHNIPEAWVNSYKVFSFSCSLTYAGKTICQVKICKNAPAKRSFFFLVDWNEKINFPLRIKALPRETMLTIKLLGVNSASKNTEVLAWTCSPLYPKQQLVHGTVLLNMTLYSTLTTTMIAPGICSTDTPTSVTLQVDFPETNLDFIKPEPQERRGDLEEATKECLKHITKLSQTHSLLLLSEQQKRILWFCRYYCNNQNCSLPLILGSAPSWDRTTISEMYAMLRTWIFSNPLEALGLLTFSFPDQDIRRAAVQQIENLSNDELLTYLPQLVQVLKFEWSLESPLVKLLLMNRSLQSIQVAHQLYWLLKNAQNEVNFKIWYQKILAALQFCAGKVLNNEFSKERKLIRILEDIAKEVKAAIDPKRKEVLKVELNRLQQFFQEVKFCRLPLNPALVVQGIDAGSCSYFTSNAFPLKISFINANAPSGNVNVIFKVGDDLRQDMLVLQIVRVMDNIWLQEGLDMQMIIYRCLSTGKGQGLVQMVPDATTLAKIHRESGLIGPLKENTINKWFSHHHPLESSYQEAIRNFFYSCAGWCVVTFILGVCDRHSDNIMLTNTGHMFHIDFGRFLGHAQTFGSIRRDRAPFIFTSEMEYFITEGGKNPQRFQEFVELCCRAYNIVRKHSQLLLNLLEMMLHAGLPELNSIQDLKYVYNNLRPQDSDLQATSYFTRKIKESLECFPVKLNNLIHTLVQMSVTSSAKPPAPETIPQQWMMLDTEKSIARATILGFTKKSDYLYLVQVVQTCNVVTFVEKSFDQFSKLHSHLQKQFPSHALPEFPHSSHLPFRDLQHKRVKDLNLYMKQLLSGSRKLANNELVLSFFLNWCKNTVAEGSSSVALGPQSTDHKPGVQLIISYENTRLTIMLKHMKNIRLPDGSAPSAHAEFYLLPDPDEVSRRKTRTAPKSTDPTYNEIVVYDKVTELKGHVLKLVVKSRGTFVGAVNIQLSSVQLNEEKWYPLGNSII
ncbi:PREDICTED: LOW QUALITY PROTEIN: phosphatidylinositol 4-phosphate 3-kinase C2 domain-containing subunit gamma [Chaetura pelagica]|uniref:LOW QUALITY PROTEIN: phosphatidylinositol 4-phosphate 3-kinase C2 domain-containing subunit gamma n=1 Tax=Chaetura pelagica TaxID=8897 RepID=UPI000523A97A|nr:PREDICTED: LOW QUALITY PROTEIN: phosphatidylinositol 4-phosphate 3-kinase C2 domain-containing subunit gamma [Chaetura pelagica]